MCLYNYSPTKIYSIEKLLLNDAIELNDNDKIIKLSNLMLQGTLISANYTDSLMLLHNILSRMDKPTLMIDGVINTKFLLLSLIHIEILFNIGEYAQCVEVAKDILSVIRKGYDYLNIIEIVCPINSKEQNFIDYAKDDINGIKSLLNDKSVNIDAQNKFGDTALIKASFNGQDDIVKILLDANASLNMQDNFGHTALIDASRQGYDKVAKQLIDAKANLNIQNIYGKTALILASFYNHSDIVKLLVNAGANRNIKDNDGKTALMYAREKGYSDIVSLLNR